MLESLVQCMNDANATRYLNGIGLVIVLYDHCLTFSEEVRLVWQAKPSFAKRLFLVNRYLVPAVLIGWAFLMNNFSNNQISTTTICRRFFGFSSLSGVISIGIANVLVLLRVVNLWERSRRAACVMFLGLFISFSTTFCLMVVVIIKATPWIEYMPAVHMCVVTVNITEVRAVWASPMLFEVLVLLAVWLNALDRPRTQTCEVKRALWRDGIGFFAALTILRSFNLILTTVVRPTLFGLGVFFIWSMTTLVLNRALLDILKMANDARSETSALALPVPNVLSMYSTSGKEPANNTYELR